MYIKPLVFRNDRIAVDSRTSRWHIADPNRYEFATFDAKGRLLARVEKTHSPIPLEQDFFRRSDELWASQHQTTPGGIAEAREGLKAFPDQKYFPPIMGIVSDDAGGVWVRESESQWSVFDSTGRWITSLRVPVRHIVEIGHDYVLAIIRDQDDIDSVVEYPLHRMTAAP